MAALLNELLPLLADYEAAGFSQYRQRWQQLDAFAGKPVALTSGSQRQVGIARGVDERGALQLETSLGIQSIHGGEVSLRAQP